MNEIFLEVVIAGRITAEAQAVFESKKRIKLFEYGSERIVMANDAKDFKHVITSYSIHYTKLYELR